MGFHNRSVVDSVSMMKACRIQRFRVKSNRDVEAKSLFQSGFRGISSLQAS